MPEFKTFPAPDVSLVRFFCHELTALCPLNKKPNFYHLLIEYEPDKVCLESKSLKEYLQTYRDKKVFAEQLVADIVDDLVKALDPIQIKVELNQQIKGGIETSVTVLRKLKDYKEYPS